MAEGDACPRCEVGVLEVDDVDGFILCPSCGFVADDAPVLTAQQGPGEERGGFIVAEDDGGGRAAAALGGGSAWQHGVHSQGGSYSHRTMKKALDNLQAAASTLKLASHQIEEAQAILRQVREGRLVHIGGAENSAAAQAGGVLFLVARKAGLPMLLSEVAAAMQASPSACAAQYKAIASALQISVSVPSTSIRALVLRLAAETLQQLQDEAEHQRQEEEAEGGPAAEQQEGGGHASTVFLHNVRQHPFVKNALSLAELVTKLGLGEGRPPRMLAVAVLLMVSDQPLTASGLPSALAPGHWPKLARVNKDTVDTTRKVLIHGLLQISALLPMGSHINDKNIMSYLPLINSLAHTLVALAAKKRPADAPPAELQAAPAPPGTMLPLPAPSQGTSGAAAASSGHRSESMGAGGYGAQTEGQEGPGGKNAGAGRSRRQAGAMGQGERKRQKRLPGD